MSAACKHVTSVSSIQNQALLFDFISKFPCTPNTLRDFNRFFYFNKSSSFFNFCFQVFRKGRRYIDLKYGICLKNLRKAAYMIPMLVRKNKFIYELWINIKFLNMFEMKRYILSSVEKKEFAVC